MVLALDFQPIIYLLVGASAVRFNKMPDRVLRC